jgi:ABC-type nitrate/sulfonate/bicarbonate transport system substrate-binding protein
MQVSATCRFRNWTHPRGSRRCRALNADSFWAEPSQRRQSQPRPVFAQSRKQVKFLFDVLPNPTHALSYPAAKKGFFADHRLDVTFLRSGSLR